MKYLSALLLIMSFTGISVFGFFLVDYAMMHDSNSGCFVSVVDGTECPASAMGMTLHHIASVQTLTTTVVPSISGLILLLASLSLVLVSVFLFYKKLLFPKLELLPQRLRDLMLTAILVQQKNTSWLSLFELSPSL